MRLKANYTGAPAILLEELRGFLGQHFQGTKNAEKYKEKKIEA
jgi:hypothetical protein